MTTSLSFADTLIIQAQYQGDGDYESSSGYVQQVVVQYPTTTTPTSSLNPSRYGQTVTFTATVTSAGPSAPPSKVLFKDGTTTIGSPKLNAGVATLTKSKLTVGTHAITAEYLGDAVSAQSTSSVLDQVVQ